MTRFIFLAGLVALAGCGTDGADSFRDGFPRADTVKFRIPESGTDTQGLAGERQDALEGETAMFYRFTREATRTVNGAVVGTLAMVERIVESPPSALSEDGAVWGPHTDPLSPNTFRFAVTRTAPNEYEYALQGKGKAEGDEAFRTLLAGRHVVSSRRYGNGLFIVDWSKARELPEHDDLTGQGEFAYTHTGPAAEARVDARLLQVHDEETDSLVDARYGFRQTPGQGGTLDFELNKDLVPGAAIELLVVRSRWAESGAGRSDARITGGNLGGAEATFNECWDASFLSRFARVSFDPSAGWGDPAACVFGSADYVVR